MKITPELEKMIFEGRARYGTIQIGGDLLSGITIPDKNYIVLLGMEFTPAHRIALYFNPNLATVANTMNPANSGSPVVWGIQMASRNRSTFAKRTLINPYRREPVQDSGTANFIWLETPEKNHFEFYEPIEDYLTISAGIIQASTITRAAAASWNFPEVANFLPFTQSGGQVTPIQAAGGTFNPLGNQLSVARGVSPTNGNQGELFHSPAGVAGFSPANNTYNQGPYIVLHYVQVFEPLPNTMK